MNKYKTLMIFKGTNYEYLSLIHKLSYSFLI